LTAEWRRTRGTASAGLPPKGPYELDTDADIAPLPASWAYTPIGNVAAFQQGMQIAKKTRFKEPGPDRLPILRIGNYSTGFAENVEYTRVDEDTLIAEADDLIVARTGETRGKVLTGYRGVFHNNTFRLNFEKGLVARDYLLHWRQTAHVQRYIRHHSGRSAQPDLTHKAFGPCPFPLPPTDEQTEIVRILREMHAVRAGLERRLTTITRLVRRLPQAILSKAFAGELVPTDADLARIEGRESDPAARLLERVSNGHPALAPKQKKIRSKKSATGQKLARADR
jgi:type I restriction enzyme S subunit